MALEKAAIGWKEIAGLGVGLVVAGQFAGWNYGLAVGGWGNMLVATGLMSMLCFGLALCVAELASALPNAGGLYTYCEAAFGRSAGYAVGVAVFTALAIGSGAAAEFISAYARSVLGVGGAPLKLALFIAIIALHVRGVGEALAALLVAGALAVVALLVFGVAMAPHFSAHNLATSGQISIGGAGVFACIPFAIWLFLSIEQIATSAEEAREPGRDIPKGVAAAIAVLMITALCVLVLGPGAGGVERVAKADDPLYAAMSAVSPGATRWLAPVVGGGAVLGLIATMFSLIYGASRQLFALARDAYAPQQLAWSNHAGAPAAALLVVGAIGFPLSFVSPSKILVAVVLLLSASYVVMLAGFIRLRLRRPGLARPYRAPGGVVTAGAVLVLSVVVLIACIQSDRDVLLALSALAAAAAAWFLVAGRLRDARPNHAG